jgi:hypothetical protein
METFGERDVLWVEVILIAGHVAGYASSHFPRRVGKPVPDRFAFAVFVPGAFVLIGRCRDAPKETFRKSRFLDEGFRHRSGCLTDGDWVGGITTPGIECNPRGCGQRTSCELTTIHHKLLLAERVSEKRASPMTIAHLSDAASRRGRGEFRAKYT